METDTSVEFQDLDSAWEQRTTATTQSKSSTPPQRPIGKPFESYAAATSFDQVSGMTEPEHPRDVRHDELSSKIANLEAMIVQLCQQVQALTNRPSDQNDQILHEQSEKRVDRKDSPRKHKPPQRYSAHSAVEEDTNEPAPKEDDRPTVWDDYLSSPQND